MRPPLSLLQKLALWAGTTVAGLGIGLVWIVYSSYQLQNDYRLRDALAFPILMLVPIQAAMLWTIGGFVVGFLLFLLAFLLPPSPTTPES
jgi:hypothetical protein